MRRSNSYSLQKINPNLISQRNQSRMIAPKDRLSFPSVKDSGYYGGVGKKHYQKSTQFIHKLILNPDYGTQNEQLPRSNSQQYFKYSPSTASNQQNTKIPKKQIKEPIDSLTILQNQITKKLITEASPIKSSNKIDQQIDYYSQIPHRKHSYDTPSSLYSNNPFKIFDGVDKMYQIIHNSPTRNPNEQMENVRKKFNPTYLSSELGYV